MQIREKREDVVRLLNEKGAALLSQVLPPVTVKQYASQVKVMPYEQQAMEFGKRKVKQNVASVRVPSPSRLNMLADEIEQGLRDFFGDGTFSEALSLNNRNIQRYPHNSIGIEPHRDHASNRQLIALFTFDGTGRFQVYEELGGPVRETLLLTPGTILLMKAPGFQGQDECPVHGVDSIIGSEDGYRYILGLRQNTSEK